MKADAIPTNTVLPRIGQEFLTRISTGTATTAVALSAKDNEFGNPLQ
jgi:hypothetical protein